MGAREGIYKSSDAGKSWRKVLDQGPYPPVEHIVIDPANPQRMYATGMAIVGSVDGGETWVPIKDGYTSLLQIDPNGSGALLAGPEGSDRRLQLSRDGGLTWNIISASADSAVFVPQHPGWIYRTEVSFPGATLTQLFLSTDWGANWTALGSRLQGFYSNLTIDPEQPNILYAYGDGLVKSTDGGLTFQSTGNERLSGIRLAFLPSACEGGAFFSGLVSPLYTWDSRTITVSLDAGQTWRTGPFSLLVDVATGPGCAAYALRTLASDVFVSKFAPSGELLWATYLGGINNDVANAAAVDSNGNVFVAGYTESSDFQPTSSIGPRDFHRIFVAKFDRDGIPIYSTAVGGTSTGIRDYGLAALAVDSLGNAYVTGGVHSSDLPVTPGAYQGGGSGYVIKLKPDGTIKYATYLGTWSFPFAIAVDQDGQAVVIGGYYISRLSPDGSRLTFQDLTSPFILANRGAMDGQGNLYLAGTRETVDFPVTSYDSHHPSAPWVAKLSAGDFRPLFVARLADQGTFPVALAARPDGSVAVTFLTPVVGFPLDHPIAEAGLCKSGSPFSGYAVALLSPDGASLLFSTYTDECAASALAIASDGSLLVGGVSWATFHGTVLKLPVDFTLPVWLESVGNAFSGTREGVSPGMLVALAGNNLGPDPAIDLGLNDSALPLELGGTRVYFDGVAAPIMLSSPGRVICVAPPGMQGNVAVQVEHDGNFSNPMSVAVWRSSPQLLRGDFPANASSYGNVRNSDGTMNSADQPAIPASTITAFVTGMPPPSASVPNQLFAYWNGFASGAVSYDVLPDFVPGIFQIHIVIPTNLNGAQALALSFATRPPPRPPRGEYPGDPPLQAWEISAPVSIHVK